MEKQSRRAKYNRNKTAKNKHKPPTTENRDNVKVNKVTENVDEAKSSSENAAADSKVQSRENITTGITSVSEPPKYNKRNLVSNWERYEEPPENERELGDVLRGSDFNDVINFGGGSVFRFKEDLVWEKEIETTSRAEEFFSLDVDDLTEAILCVPLPRRLLIDTDAFPKKMLAKLEASAHKNSLQYVHKRSVKSRAKADEINKEIILVLKDNQISTTSETHSDEENIGLSSTDELNPQEDNKTETAETVVDEDGDSEALNEKIDSPTNENLEDDLDLLLSLDKTDATIANAATHPTAATVKSEAKPEPIQLFPESNSDNLEDWLDTLLEAP